MYKFCKLFLMLFFGFSVVVAQDIPNHISYHRIYDFLDELANDGFIELNSAVKPYSQLFIAEKLQDIANTYSDRTKNKQLCKRQKKELEYFLNEYALEFNHLPQRPIHIHHTNQTVSSILPPVISYKGEYFKARIAPILGMHITSNGNEKIIKRWYGAEFQGMMGKNLSIYGSLRDISHTGDDLLSKPTYLNNEPGYEYTVGSDFSDSRGGIKYANKKFSIGLIKDNISWGDNYHCSNILSGRAPSFPMIYLQVKPAGWFELNYFHGWLVSNVLDSTYYYLENDSEIHYRPANKFIAANLLTFTPVKNLKLSVGNSIVYAERNVHPAYFIPIAFYKSLDHVLTKGLGVENQNSQLFLNISSRNIRHLHVFASVFIDEMQLRRFKPDSPDKNPISYKVGANLSNFLLKNFSAVVEYTKSNILNYKHSISTLTWASNSYNLGHYLGDNAQELYAALRFKPIRGLDFQLYYVNAKHGNEYEYIRRGVFNGEKASVIDIISNPSLGDVIWTNETIGFNTTYEIFRNAYAVAKVEKSDIRSFDAISIPVFGENRMTAQEVMNRFTPQFLQGNNITFTVGFSFGF
ncbi:MAG: hypothetical protein PHZ12_05220 [Paludibacter sp.]|nr:hypothetical protein [Paludibacter sp.]